MSAAHAPGRECCPECATQHRTLVAQLTREVEAWRQSKDRTPQDARDEIAALIAANDAMFVRLTRSVAEAHGAAHREKAAVAEAHRLAKLVDELREAAR